jgi:transcriptional regulator with XRE-family HTH domain
VCYLRGELTTREGVIALVKYRVKELARARGMTQFDLAKKSEVSITAIQRLWQNRAPEGIRHSTLAAVAAALGVSIDDLFEVVDESAEGATLRVNRESLGAAAA